MNSLWSQPQPQQLPPHHTQIPPQSQYLGIDIELDQDACSEPGSVPLPNEDFEPFFTDYAAYDERLQNTLNRVQDLGISENDHYDSLSSVPPQQVPFSMHRQLKYNSFEYYEPEPEPMIENTWSSPRKNPPMPEVWSSPIKPAHINFHDDPHPQSSPVRNRNRTPVFQNGPSPEFFSPKTPALHDNRQLFSPSHAPPLMDLPSSPPGSPYMRPAFRPAPPLDGVDSLGIVDTASQHNQHQEQDLVEVKTESDEALQWEPVLTIPVEVHRESDRIIRSQRSMNELKSKRKSCLPPGTVDEFISGPDDGTYKCLYPHCGRLFRRKYNLKSHIQTHLCDRPYICDSCDASFVRPHDLKRHELCHKTTRQFVCPCGKGFTRMDAMQRHKARMICDGGVPGGATHKSPRKRRAKPASSSSPSDSGSSSDGDSTPVLF